MRKIIALILAILIVMSMAVSASAVTPPLKVPSITIPKIEKVEVTLPQSFWDSYFRANPIKIDFSKIKFN